MIITPNKSGGGASAFQVLHGRPFVSEGESAQEAMAGLIDVMASHCAKHNKAIDINRPVYGQEPRMVRGQV